ncbi:polyprenyl diphosphate synthase [Streptomyces sp. NPDC002787]
MPRHLGIVLDGNRRWARARGLTLPREGHLIGFAKIPDVLDWCEEFGIEIVTPWMPSDDNIRNRSQDELSDLYAIDADVITRLATSGRWRLHPIGDLELLPAWLAARLRAAEAETDGCGGMLVNLALGYGGRRDVLSAVRALIEEVAAGRTLPGTITEAALARHLSTAGQPDPDLVIRPSGEVRTSGFLLWQAALAEYYFCDRLWPDCNRADLLDALRAYSRRQRRLGA